MRGTVIVSAMKKRLAVALWLVLFTGVVRAQAPVFEVHVSKGLMGTRVEATVLHDDVPAARAALVKAFREMERVEALLSRHIETSDVSRVNRAAGRMPVRVRAETFAVLRRAREASARYEGLFDITIGPLSALWGFSDDRPVRVPDPDTLAARRALVDYHDLILDPADTTAFLRRPGMMLDLGGVAKGYAIDRAVAVLRAEGMKRFLVDAGGDLYAAGTRADGGRWRVGIKHPRRPDALVATLELQDQAVATSGDYERFVIRDGRRYHHLLDPRTGYPADGFESATVLASSAEAADALATYVFIAGPERAGAAEYVVIDRDGRLRFDPALARTHAFVVVPDP